MQIYQLFLRKLLKKEDFIFNPSGQEKKVIENFIDLLNKEVGIISIGRNYIHDYFIFQLNYWVNLDTRFGKKIPISWFIGKKAYDRWLNNKEEDLWHAHQSAKLLNISRPDFEYQSKDFNEVKDHEETSKQIFYNKDEGFQTCIETTTLYNHRSIWCISCIFRRECKDLLKENYFRIYLKRGYE